MQRNIRNNLLSGSIPNSFKDLSSLVYLDLSNNRLTGPFPGWAHNLTKLCLLNLGQNDISGEIPLVLGERQSDGGHRLTNVREFLHLPITADASFRLGGTLWLNLIRSLKRPIQYKRRHEALRQIFGKFLKETPLRNSVDLLWIGRERTFWWLITLEEVIEEYIKAEENHLLTKVFQKAREMDPVLLIQKLNLLESR